MPLTVGLHTSISAVEPHPSVTLTLPPGFKILGGGAFDNYGTGAGNLLTASYPKDLHTWVAAGKDHEVSDPASITAYVFAINDPQDEWDVVIKSATSAKVAHPQIAVTLDPGYILTGGGAFVDWTGAGNLLTASYPNGDFSWEARSKDHDVSDPSTITAYAIGLKPRSSSITLLTSVRSSTSPVEAHPTAQACLMDGWTLTGGGAFDNYGTGAGNLLTASYPQPGSLCWLAAGKDHIDSNPASITSFAIGIAIRG